MAIMSAVILIVSALSLSVLITNILATDIQNDITARIMSKILTAMLAPYKPLPNILFTVVLIL